MNCPCLSRGVSPHRTRMSLPQMNRAKTLAIIMSMIIQPLHSHSNCHINLTTPIATDAKQSPSVKTKRLPKKVKR